MKIQTVYYKEIPDYEGYYVTTDGMVLSTKNGCLKVMRAATRRKGYKYVNLWKNNKGKKFSVHRLVAEAFISNPNNLPQVNHINKNKTDNRVENLEWCTNQYNSEYSFGKPVVQYTLDGTLVREWPSASEVKRQTGWNRSGISQCCRGELKTAYGYKWCYKEENPLT